MHSGRCLIFNVSSGEMVIYTKILVFSWMDEPEKHPHCKSLSLKDRINFHPALQMKLPLQSFYCSKW